MHFFRRMLVWRRRERGRKKGTGLFLHESVQQNFEPFTHSLRFVSSRNLADILLFSYMYDKRLCWHLETRAVRTSKAPIKLYATVSGHFKNLQSGTSFFVPFFAAGRLPVLKCENSSALPSVSHSVRQLVSQNPHCKFANFSLPRNFDGQTRLGIKVFNLPPKSRPRKPACLPAC